eukprot:9473506-Pyramimonas_sp.AAC.1
MRPLGPLQRQALIGETLGACGGLLHSLADCRRPHRPRTLIRNCGVLRINIYICIDSHSLGLEECRATPFQTDVL